MFTSVTFFNTDLQDAVERVNKEYPDLVSCVFQFVHQVYPTEHTVVIFKATSNEHADGMRERIGRSLPR